MCFKPALPPSTAGLSLNCEHRSADRNLKKQQVRFDRTCCFLFCCLFGYHNKPELSSLDTATELS